MSSADRVVDGQLIPMCDSHARWLDECLKVIKPSNPFYECLLGFCFNNIFCAATNFGCIDGFSSPNSRNEEMMGDGFLGATAAGLF